MEILRDNEFITQVTSRPKRQIQRDMTLYCARISRLSNLKSVTDEECERRENSWVLALNSQRKNGPMNQREDCAEPIRIKERLYEESGEGNTKINPNYASKEKRESTVLNIPRRSRTN